MKRQNSVRRLFNLFYSPVLKSTTSKSPKSRRACFETLESRQLLSATPLCPTQDLKPREELIILSSPIVPEIANSAIMGNVEESLPRFFEAFDELLVRAGQNPNNLSENFVFNLSSNPASNYTIYLDFNGNVHSGSNWNNGRGVVTPAYDTDGDETTFCNSELRDIYEVWLRVSEDYMPFDVNVTTKEPSLDRLVNSGSDDACYGIRVAIGGSNADWYNDAAGGVAYLNSFTWNTDTPCFVFPKNCAGGRNIAAAASHEVGHTLGLYHDGNSYVEYYNGDDGWAPIMGTGYSQGLTTFSNGDYEDANNLQDDLAIITTNNGFGYRVDDHGDSFSNATELTFSASGELGSGIIERVVDVDFFTFTLNGEESIITVGGINQVTNLDALVKIYDSERHLVETYDPTTSLYVSIDVSDYAPGRYYMSVEGTGMILYGKTIYSDYGILGAYTITTELASSVTDPYEPNEGSDYAYRLGILTGVKTINSQISPIGDVDAFSFTTIATGTQNDYVRVDSLDNQWNVACLGVRLVNSSGSQVGFAWAQSVATLSLEGLAPGTYSVQIYNYFQNPDASRYVLTISTSGAILNAPSIAVSPVGTSGAVVSIAAVHSAIGYLLEYSTDRYFRTKTSETVSAGVVEISDLDPTSNYYFRVRALGDGTNYAHSDFQTVELSKRMLAAPTLVLRTRRATSIDVEIGTVGRGVTYILEWSTNQNFSNASQAAYDSSGSKTISGLRAGTTYYFRVKSHEDGSTDSEWSTLVTTTLATSDLLEPNDSLADAYDLGIQTGVTPYSSLLSSSSDKDYFKFTTVNRGTSDSYIQVDSLDYQWNVTCLGVRLRNPNGSEVEFSWAQSVATISLEGLEPGTYSVEIYNYFENSNPSQYVLTISAPQPTVALEAPVVMSTPSKGAIVLKINAVSNATNYVVQYADNANFENYVERNYSSGTKTISGLESETTYYFRVKATAEGYLDSEWTSFAATTKKETLPSPTLTSVASTTGSITVSIGIVEAATKYVLEYASNSDFSSATQIKLTGAGSRAITGLTPATTYYVRVKATADRYYDSEWTTIVAETQYPSDDQLDSPIFTLSGTKNAVVIKLNPVEGAEKYVVDYSTDPGFATFSTKSYSSSGVKTITGVATGTWYWVRVKATATGRPDSSYAPTAKIYTGSSLKMPVVSCSAVKTAVVLNIKPVENGEKYVVEYSENEDFSNSKTKTYSSDGVKTISGLTFGTRYYFRVKATSSTSNDSMWNIVNFAAGQLAVPARVATSVGSDFVNIKCYNSPNASGFEVKFSTNSDFSDAQYVQGPSSGLVQIVGLQPNTKYYFSAKALGDYVSRVDSNWSPSLSATTKNGTQTLGTPSLSTTPYTTQVVVKIGTVSGASGYVLEYGTDPNFGASSTTVVSYDKPGAKTISGLTPRTTYYLRVKATAANFADSAWTTKSFTTNNASLDAPVVSASTTNSAIIVRINPVENANSYVLEFGTDPNFSTFSTKTYSTSGVKTIASLNLGTRYFLRVKATAEGITDSSWSTLSARTLGVAVPAVTASVTKNAVALNIRSVEDATSYVVEYSTNSTFNSFLTRTYTSSGVKTISGLSSGTSYYFRIKAVSIDYGESEWTTLEAVTKGEAIVGVDSAFENYFDDELNEVWDLLF